VFLKFYSFQHSTKVFQLADNGKLALSVRYGTSILELAKNKYAIEVGTERDLVAVLETVRTATLNGELDNAMATASTKLRAAFGK